MFNEYIKDIKDILTEKNINIDVSNYDGIVVKRLTKTNTLNQGRSSNQTHIAITGEQMDIFPYLRSSGYFEEDNKKLKKYFILEIKINIFKKNIEYLSEESLSRFNFTEGISHTTTTVVRSKRNDGSEQVQLSLLARDGKDFIEFRKLIRENDYLVILKHSKKFEYDAFAIKGDEESEKLQNMNSKFGFRKEETLISVDNLNDIECNSESVQNKNIQNIYFGAPGTGKSYEVSQLIKRIYPTVEEKNNPFVFKTTIYSDYSYYDFIGNLVPTHKDEKLDYDFTPGVFTQALAMALNRPDREIFLVIEEMSRGNIASIFGDVFQLLDRNEQGESDYSINNDLITEFLRKKGIEQTKISLPRNMHILGTVNTSDQNVNVIDTAFKRRFGFVYSDVSPVKKKDADGNDTEEFANLFNFELGNSKFEWNRFYMSLNKLITEHLGLSEDKQIGQFFIKFNNYNSDEDRKEAIQNKLLHYLWEDVQSMAIDDDKTIFDSEYKTFSKLYKDFATKNVFSEKLMQIYDEINL